MNLVVIEMTDGFEIISSVDENQEALFLTLKSIKFATERTEEVFKKVEIELD